MTLKDIVRQWLALNGFDGLFHPDGECACGLCDLWPCEQPNGDCQAGHFVSCPWQGCEGYGDEGHFHIGLTKTITADGTEDTEDGTADGRG